ALALPVRAVAVTTVNDVARVRLTDDMPSGLADFGGLSRAVGGIVIAGRDADLGRLVDGVRRTLGRARPRLPPEVQIVTAYDRLDLVERVGRTLTSALRE